MQFTSKLTEDEYMEAYRLHCKSPYRAIANAFAYTLAGLFWIFLIASWIFKALHPNDLFLGQNVSAFQQAILPGALGILLWVLFFRVYTPYDTRRKFRKTRSFQIEVSNEINSEGLGGLLRIFPVGRLQPLARIGADDHCGVSHGYLLHDSQICRYHRAAK